MNMCDNTEIRGTTCHINWKTTMVHHWHQRTHGTNRNTRQHWWLQIVSRYKIGATV